MESRHEYINGLRYHVTPIGSVPGVTTVLGATKSKFSKLSIKKWERKVGQKMVDKIYQNSTKRGDQLHKTIEAFLTDSKPDPIGQESLALWKLVRPFVESVKASNKPMFIEQHTHHPDKFAGTPDLVAEIDGKMTVVDWKNSRKVKTRSMVKDYILQVSAYAKSFEFTYGTKVEQAIIVCAVYPDKFLPITDPGIEVEPQLLKFHIKPKSLELHWGHFQKRLREFHHKQENPDWFDTDIDESKVIW